MAANNVSFDKILERLNREIISNLLLRVDDAPIILQDINDYIVANLTPDDKQACIFLNQARINELMAMPAANIVKARVAMIDMLNLLRRNIEPNAGVNQARGDVDWGIVPKLTRFSGKLEEGFNFLQNFKSIMNNSPNKVNMFGALLEGESSLWFQQGNFEDFAVVEAEFLKTWCLSLTSAKAIARAGKIHQKEDEHIRIYINKFKELHRFFTNLDNSLCSEIFLSGIRKSLHHYRVNLLKQNLAWPQLLTEITTIDNAEPRDISKIQKKPVLAASSSSQQSSEVLVTSQEVNVSEEISNLKRKISELEDEKKKEKKGGIWCYNCNKRGHVSKDCCSKKAKNKDNENKSSEEKSGKGKQD